MALPRFCPSKNSRSSLKDTTGSINLSEKTSISLPRLCASKNSHSSFKDSTGSINLSEKTSIYSSISSVASRRHKPKHLKVIVPQLGNHESLGSGIEKTPLTGFRLQFEKLRRSSQSSLSISSLLRKAKVEKRKTLEDTQSYVPISWPQTSCETRFPTIQDPHLVQELYSMPTQDDQETTSHFFSFTENPRGSISDGFGLKNKARVESNKGIAHRISHQRTETETQLLTLKRKPIDRKSSTKHKFRAQSYSSFSFLDPRPIPDPTLTSGVLEITLQASLNHLCTNHDLQTNPSSSVSQEPIDDNLNNSDDDDDDDDRSSFCTVSDRHSLEYEPYHLPKWPTEA